MTALHWLFAAAGTLFVISVGLTIAWRRADAEVCDWANVTAGDEETA